MPFFGPFVGSTFRIMWCSTMTFQRNAMIQKSCSWRTWRNANRWFEQQPKKSVKTNKPLAGVWKKTQKNLGLNLFLCVRKVDYITTSFKNQHGTSHGDLIWTVSLFFESSRKSLVGSHQLDINPFGHEQKSLASERSRNPLWVAIQIHTFQMPISHSCLGLKNKLQFAVFFGLGRFLQVSVSFFFGKWSTRKFSWKAAKKVSGLVKLCFLGRVFAYHLRSYPILAANKPENMRLDGSGQHLGGKTDGFLRNQGQQGAVGFRKMWGVDGFTRCEGYKMLGKSWWCFSNNFFLDGEKLVLNFKLTPRFLLTTGVKTL